MLCKVTHCACRTRFIQYQASLAAPGDGDSYLMHRIIFKRSVETLRCHCLFVQLSFVIVMSLMN